jgi:hypothetical protein
MDSSHFSSKLFLLNEYLKPENSEPFIDSINEAVKGYYLTHYSLFTSFGLSFQSFSNFNSPYVT